MISSEIFEFVPPRPSRASWRRLGGSLMRELKRAGGRPRGHARGDTSSRDIAARAGRATRPSMTISCNYPYYLSGEVTRPTSTSTPGTAGLSRSHVDPGQHARASDEPDLRPAGEAKSVRRLKLAATGMMGRRPGRPRGRGVLRGWCRKIETRYVQTLRSLESPMASDYIVATTGPLIMPDDSSGAA